MLCECCGEGKDPMNETETEWQCNDCEQWNDKETEPVVIPDAAVEHMQRWANARDMTTREMMLSIAFVHEIMRVLDDLKKEKSGG